MRDMWLKCHDGRFAVDLGFRFTLLKKNKSSALLLRKGKGEEDSVGKSSRSVRFNYHGAPSSFHRHWNSLLGRLTGRRRLLTEVESPTKSSVISCALSSSNECPSFSTKFTFIIFLQLLYNHKFTIIILIHYICIHSIGWCRRRPKTEDLLVYLIIIINLSSCRPHWLDSHTFDWVMQRFIHLWLVGLGSIFKVNIIFLFPIWRGNTIQFLIKL